MDLKVIPQGNTESVNDAVEQALNQYAPPERRFVTEKELDDQRVEREKQGIPEV